MIRSFTISLATIVLLPFGFADGDPDNGLINFESPHVHPLDLTPDATTLLAVNTPMGTLEVFDVTSGTPVLTQTIPVGLDPVSVRARSNGEAWVVNHVSDSISVVSLGLGVVIGTLSTGNEPADVVFAGSPQRAFVTCSEANLVQVFDPSNLGASPTDLAILAEEPRALAVSPDGLTVYAAVFESGNRSITLNGRVGPISTGEGLGSENVVSRPEGPYGGQNPAPNSGSGFQPPIIAPGAPNQSIIVRQNAQGDWMDDNSGDWSIFVDGGLATTTRRVPGWNLPDRDVAVINSQSLAVSYQTSLMNLCMAIAVRPTDGRVTVVGTDATNEVRFEPNINGTFLRVLSAGFGGSLADSIDDLNPHLDYSTPTVSLAVRQQSIGDPRGVAWRSNGGSAFVTGMGSNNVIEVDATGARIRTIGVGQGPTGIILDESRGRVHVLNKFDASVSSFDLATGANGTERDFYDPTPEAIQAGRPFFYDTHLTSGLGHVSCASCHVDARTDRLAWDLGDPTGPARGLHPVKGPMLTQSLVDIIRHPNMHWRGDRNSLAFFNPAFVSLMGAESQIGGSEMDAFEGFLDTIHFPPNPYRNLDNSRSTNVTLPDGRVESGFGTLSGCISCHMDGQTRSAVTSNELSQQFIPPTFHGFYERIGYWPNLQSGSTAGFGFFHDGADPLFVAGRGPVNLAAILSVDGPDGLLVGAQGRKDVHAGVGRQITVNGTASSAQNTLLNQLLSIAAANPHAALIAKGMVGGQVRGFVYDGSNFQSDAAGESFTQSQLMAIAEAGSPVTWTLVAEGTQTRLGIDRDLDGVLDFDADPTPRVSIASVNVGEAAGTAQVLLTLNAPSPSLLSVTFETLPGGSATPFADYVDFSDRIEFEPGEVSRPVSITLLDDQLVEGNETVQMRIFDPFGGLIGNATATLMILDNEVEPVGPLITSAGSGSPGSSGPWSIGYRFQVTEPLRVRDLGVFDTNGDGVLNGVAPVGLWNDTTGVQLAQATLAPGVQPQDQFFYAPISPVDLVPGQTYVTAAVLANGGENWFNASAPSSASQVQVLSGAFQSTSNLTFPTGSTQGATYLGPNLRLEIPGQNLPPVVSAGPDASTSISTPLQLAGSVVDDGMSEVDVLWSRVSGPSNVNFGLIFSSDSTATFYVPGTYVLRLTADDGTSVVSDDVVVEVLNTNTPPVVDAGPNFQVETDEVRNLMGVATDSGPLVSTSWEKISGPGGVNFTQIFLPTSPTIFYVPGTYVLRLTAEDGEFVVTDDVTVTVVPPGGGNPPPVVDAGPDRTAVTGTPITLQGSVVDTEAVAILWTKVSGPGGVNFGLQQEAVTPATFYNPGTYVLRLTGDDSTSQISDEITVTVTN